MECVSISDEIHNALKPASGKSYWESDCHDEACLAARDLQCAYGAVFGRDVPNTIGIGDAAESDRDFKIFNRTIRNLGRTHPAKGPLYCGFLAKAASLDLSHDDWYTDSKTIEFATRLTRPHFDCIGKVMAALPHTEAAKVRIAHTKEKAARCRNFRSAAASSSCRPRQRRIPE